MILSICMEVCQHDRADLRSAICLGAFLSVCPDIYLPVCNLTVSLFYFFPAVWPRQQISSKCGDWQAVTGFWEHTLLIIRHMSSFKNLSEDKWKWYTICNDLLFISFYLVFGLYIVLKKRRVILHTSPHYHILSIIAKPCRHLTSSLSPPILQNIHLLLLWLLSVPANSIIIP